MYMGGGERLSDLLQSQVKEPLCGTRGRGTSSQGPGVLTVPTGSFPARSINTS